jgi:hypothetical protein
LLFCATLLSPHWQFSKVHCNAAGLIAGAKSLERTTPLGIAKHHCSVGTSMAVDGHGHAMTIPDYIAVGILIALALSAGAMLYLRGKLY